MKKRFFCRAVSAALAAVFLLAAVLTGCGVSGGAEDPGQEAGAGLQVVTTIFPPYDFARQIAGGSADVTMLLKPGEEVHSYEPTPQDIKTIQNCDLFFYTGGENDVWVDSILDSMGDRGPRAVRLIDLVDTCAEEELEGMMPEKHDHEQDHDHEHDHDHDHEDGEEVDEHVWTSPENCVILIEKMTEEFCGADPAHASQYRKNGENYRKAFEELDEQYREMAASAGRRTLLFGDRFPFRYLAEELSLTCYAAFPGCSSESEPSAATIAFLINKAVEEQLPVVFQIEFSNGNIARAISEAARLRRDRALAGEASAPAGSAPAQGAGAGRIQVLQLHSCHNLTRDEFESGETCLSLMTRNLEALRTALDAPAPEAP